MAFSRSGVQLSLPPPERKCVMAVLGMKKRVSKTLYEKRGSKYIAVGKDDIVLPYGFGDYIIRVRKGSRSVHCTKKNVTGDYARLEAMLLEVEDVLASAIVQVSELEPKVRMHTKREQKAWDAYKSIAGVESLTFSRGSAQDMARKAVMILGRKLRPERCAEGSMEVFADREKRK